jgi:hypothetical protein
MFMRPTTNRGSSLKANPWLPVKTDFFHLQLKKIGAWIHKNSYDNLTIVLHLGVPELKAKLT